MIVVMWLLGLPPSEGLSGLGVQDASFLGLAGVLAAWSTHPFFMRLLFLIVGQLGSQGTQGRLHSSFCCILAFEGATKASRAAERGLCGGTSIPPLLCLTCIHSFSGCAECRVWTFLWLRRVGLGLQLRRRGLLIAVASLAAEHGLQGTWAVVVVTPGL